MVSLRDAREVLSGVKSTSALGGLLIGVSIGAVAIAAAACELAVRLYLSGR